MCHNNKIAVLCAYVIGPIARPGVRRPGPGLGLTYGFAGRAWTYLLRAGPGPHNSICGPGRVFTTAAGPGRAWASNHICGPGLGLHFRPVQDTSAHETRAFIARMVNNTNTMEKKASRKLFGHITENSKLARVRTSVRYRVGAVDFTVSILDVWAHNATYN